MELFIRSTKQVVKNSLTSAVTALSKLAFGKKQKISKATNGESRLGDVKICLEMEDDIFKYFQLAEGLNRIPDYMESQPEIDVRRRAKLADSLIWVNDEYELSTETLYLTFYIVDRYLSLEIFEAGELPLLAATATLIACKYEENQILEVDGKYVRNRLPKMLVKSFNGKSGYGYEARSRARILEMEEKVLYKLQWKLTVPTTYDFLTCFIKATQPDEDMKNLALFLAELGLVDYKCIVMFTPSMIAASAVYAAQFTLEKTDPWAVTMINHTGYTLSQLKNCTKALVRLHSSAASGNEVLKAVYDKYCRAERCAVALLPPAMA